MEDEAPLTPVAWHRIANRLEEEKKTLQEEHNILLIKALLLRDIAEAADQAVNDYWGKDGDVLDAVVRIGTFIDEAKKGGAM